MAETAQAPQEPTSGTGKFYYKNGATYEGDWKFLMPEPVLPLEPEPDKKTAKKKGKKDEEEPAPPAIPPRRVRQGKGKYQEGDYYYEGEWFEDEMHGVGKFVFRSGAVYEGQWVHNRYQGSGRYAWPDGRVYEGEWQDSKMHGGGVYVDAEGHKWSGQFFNGSGPGLTCQQGV